MTTKGVGEMDTGADFVVLERQGRHLLLHVNESFAYLELRNFYTHLRPYLMSGYRARVRRFVAECERVQGLERGVLRKGRGLREGEVRYLG